jgi:hypothetical protein
MERRQFLIGASTILTSAFVAKAEWFLEKEKAVVPLIKETSHTDVIYVVKNDFDYELRLNNPEMDLPEELTYREALDQYFGIWYPEDKPLKFSDYRELYYEHGVSPRDLDKPADWEFYLDSWARRDSSNARAYHLLEPLDLFDCDDKKGRFIGGLQFIDGCHPGNDYLGVRSGDALSASLLQARLLELNQNIAVRLVEAG